MSPFYACPKCKMPVENLDTVCPHCRFEIKKERISTLKYLILILVVVAAVIFVMVNILT